MWRVSLKTVWARKFRLVLLSVSILLGVAFMSGTLVLTNTMNHAFNDLFDAAYANTDSVVRGVASFDSDNSANAKRPPIDGSIVTTIKNLPDVASVDGSTQGFAQIVKKDGKPLGTGGAPTYGSNWTEGPLNPWELAIGSGPTNDSEVVIDKASADKTGYKVGDRISVLVSNSPPITVTVSGIARFGTADSPAGATFALFTTKAAQQYVGQVGKFDEIDIQAKKGVSQAKLTNEVKQAIPSGTEALTGKEITKENQDSLKSALKVFNIVLLVFAGIALFVGVFIIYNTFSILVAQRSKETALLRAIGATRKQIRRSVILESFFVGLIAGALGVVAGIGVAAGMKALLTAFGIKLPGSGIIVPSSAITSSLIVGIVVSIVSAYMPARRAAKIPPIAAMRDVALDRTGASKKRLAFGLLLLIAGVASILIGLFAHIKKGYIPVGAGVPVTFLGVAALGPIIVGPVISVIGWPVARFRGMTGQLARENSVRNPRRTSSTAAALMIGVGLVGFLTILTASIKSSIYDVVDKTYSGDFTIMTTNHNDPDAGMPQQMRMELAKLPEVKSTLGFEGGIASADGRTQEITGVDLKAMPSILDPQVTQGSIDNVGTDGVVIYKNVADSQNYKIGQQIQFKFVDGDTKTFTVRAIEKNPLLGGYTIDQSAFDHNFAKHLDQVVLVGLKQGISADSARAAVKKVTDQYPNAEVQDRTEYKQAVSKQLDQLLGFFVVMLGMAIVIALIGIAITLLLAVYERTREIGLLRAVGMTHRQTRSMIRWESVLIALFGVVLGLIVAVFFGASLVHALKTQGFTVFVLPVWRLALIAVIAALAGVIAAIYPARKASRIKILDAIASE